MELGFNLNPLEEKPLRRGGFKATILRPIKKSEKCHCEITQKVLE